MNQPITLPPLDIDCPDCTGEVGEKIRRANAKESRKWNEEERQAYEAFAEEYERAHKWGAWDAWLQTDTYRALSERQPEELPEVGCVECDWTGKRITEAGSQVLAFLSRHYHP